MNRFEPVAIGDARPFQRLAAGSALTIGVLTLIGLATGVDVLIRWIPSSTTMNPITAMLLIAASGALLCREPLQRKLIVAVAVAMIGVGAVKLGQAALGRPLGIDQLAAAALQQRHTRLLDAIALNTALAFVLFGIALAIGRTNRIPALVATQILTISAIAISVMALAGFALDSATINHLTFNRMAVNTAVGLCGLGLAILALNPAHGIMRLSLVKGPAGQLARIALPICLIVPVTLGVLRLNVGEQVGLSTGDGVAIMVMGNIILTLGLLWGSLTLLLRADAKLRAGAAALAVSEDQYRQAGRIGKMGHWHYDVVHDQLHWTNEFRTLLGLPADLAPDFGEMVSRIHPDDRALAQQMMQRARSNGEEWNWQIRLIGDDGRTQHCKSHGLCRRAPDGTLDSVFGVLADVTELEIARQDAEAATEAQTAFLANMSHEIRTPLNGVLGFVDLVLDSDLDPIQRRYLKMVHESAHVLLKLLNDILDLSKVEAGHVDIAPQATDVRATLRHAVRLMVPIAEQKRIELITDIAPQFPSAVMIDAGRVRQILLNLLGNAIKFTDHGTVTVALGIHSDPAADGTARFQVAVADSGVGIPADRLEAVFRAFVQADSSTSRRFGGSGLGLSISRELARLMGGAIDIDSVEGVGTTATLMLPLIAAAEEEIEQSQTADATGRHRSVLGVIEPDPAEQDVAPAIVAPGQSVLLVEDVAINRELCGEMLRRLGHRVDFACNGAEAVEMAARLAEEPDAWNLILMDIQMPVMNGKDATRAIRALGGRAATIPIIALSANAFAAEKQLSRDAGMDDHVVKPIAFAELRRTIDLWTITPPPHEAWAEEAR